MVVEAEKIVASKKLRVSLIKVDNVLPEEKRDDHVYFLDNLDQNVATTMKTVYLFRAKEEVTADPAQVIRESLVKLLRYFYPMAGRIGLTADYKLQVNYNSQGFVFVEATTDANLEDLGDISKPDERLQQLIYTSPEATCILDSPIATVQVTKFKCGGFVFGLANEHSLLDGISATEFLQCWSELARGLPVSQPPCIDRTILKARSPPQIDFPHKEFAEITDISNLTELNLKDILHQAFSFSPEDLDALKKKVVTSGGLNKCTSFEVLTALVWRARSKAMDMDSQQQTRVYFAVNGREKFVPPLPKGFMGNGIVLSFAMTTATDLCDQPLHHAVQLVQEAVALIDDRYMRSAIDYFEATHARPALPGSVIVTTWAKLPFQSTDFGWGEPWQSGPVVLPEKGMVLFLPRGEGRKGVNVLVGLPPPQMERFHAAIDAELA